MMAIQTCAHAQTASGGLGTNESLLTKIFGGLLILFLALIAWEVVERKLESRSSLDIAKLAAAAAKKHSGSAPPSGSLSTVAPTPFARPTAPPPPPPPPMLPTVPSPEPESIPSSGPSSQGFASVSSGLPPAPMGAPAFGASFTPAIDSATSHLSSVPANDSGSSGGWADLLQRVRAGEPESAPTTSPIAPSPTAPATPASPTTFAASPSPSSSSSEAWEALLKRTTSTEAPPAHPDKSGSLDKISLQSNLQFPDSPSIAPPPPAAQGPSPIHLGVPISPPEQPLPLSLNTDSPFSNIGIGSPGPVPTQALDFTFPSPAPVESNFSFPGGGLDSNPSSFPPLADHPFQAPQVSGFQLPSTSPATPGPGSPTPPASFGMPLDSSPSSTLPLSDLFASKPSSTPQPFRLPGAGAEPKGFQGFPQGPEHDPASLGRTISLDFGKSPGQKPPPPLPRTEG